MARWLVLSLLMSTAVSNFVSAQNSSQQPAVKIRQELLMLLPDQTQSKAHSQGDPAFYGPDNLYQYIDGGAEVFLLYDFQALIHQDFRVKETDLTVDIFDMGVSANAFGIYAAERSPSYHFIPIGAEAYQNEGILNFLQGRYYVKLAAYGATADTDLDEFAKVLSARIGEKPALPPLLQLLPQKNRKPHSEQYLLKDPLGHRFLGQAYVATYSTEGHESTVLVSVAGSDAESLRRLELLREHFRSTGSCEPAPELGGGAIRASNSYEGKLVARTQGPYLVLILNYGSNVRELLNDAVERLK